MQAVATREFEGRPLVGPSAMTVCEDTGELACVTGLRRRRAQRGVGGAAAYGRSGQLRQTQWRQAGQVRIRPIIAPQLSVEIEDPSLAATVPLPVADLLVEQRPECILKYSQVARMHRADCDVVEF